MNRHFSSIISFLLLTAGLGQAAAQELSLSTTKRIGVFIGSNYGGAGRANLRWAESDARSMSTVFAEMGGIARADNMLLTQPGIRQINDRLDRVAAEINRNKNDYRRVEMVFYFSGHSNEEGLLLGRELYDYKTLRDKINAVPADMRIVILDSCRSGAFTRAKGGAKVPAFLVDDQGGTSGHAFLTSSSETELSQESDAIRGSFFTHSLLAGLRGFAGTTGNGRVTLNEAYRYAYDETLLKTERSLFGRQHPSYDIQISGSGDVVLTDVRSASAGLILDETLAGRLSIRDSDGFLVAEITKMAGKPVELGLPPGRYSLFIRQSGGFLFRAEITLAEGTHTAVGPKNLTAVNADEAVARGDLGPDGAPPLFWNENPAAPGKPPAEVLEPFRIELIQGVGSGRTDVKTRNNILLGLFMARGYDLDGWGLASLGLENENNVRGMQMGYIYTITGGNLTGMQTSAVLNWTSGHAVGMQLSAVVNFQGIGGGPGTVVPPLSWPSDELPGLSLPEMDGLSGMDGELARWSALPSQFLWPGTAGFAGLQAAGVGNWSTYVVEGAQLASIYNWANAFDRGTQIAGIFNWVGGVSGSGVPMSGLQVGGLMNWLANAPSAPADSSTPSVPPAPTDLSAPVDPSDSPDVESGDAERAKGSAKVGGFAVQISGITNIAWGVGNGLQIGIVNVKEKGTGVQLGVVNVAMTDRIVPIGLVNVIKDGMMHPAVYYGDLGFFNVSFKSGTKSFYSLLRAGVRNVDQADRADGINPEATTSFGFGWEFRISKRNFIDFDISSGTIFAPKEWIRFVDRHDDNGGTGSGADIAGEGADDGNRESWHDIVTPYVTARFSYGFKIFEHLSMISGVSYTFAFMRGSEHAPLGGFFYELGDFRHGVSFFAGLQF